MTTPTRVRRLPVIDEYVEDGRSAVLVEGQALTLSEIATYALSLLGEEWTAYDALVATVEAEVGAPAEGSTSEALEQVLRDLAGHRLVELDPQDEIVIDPFANLTVVIADD